MVWVVVAVLVGAVVLLWLAVRRLSDREGLKDLFKAVAMDALAQQRQASVSELEAARQAVGAELEAKRQLIERTVAEMRQEMLRLEQRVVETQKQNEAAAQMMRQLTDHTGKLTAILGSTQKRGAWGERMVKDIIDLVGLQENINYKVQPTTAQQNRPDFMFLLPNGLHVYLDAKFPLESYRRYVEASSDQEREAAKVQLVKDARKHVQEVAERGYADPAEGALDYALVFFASEAAFHLVNEADPSFMDDALKEKVVVCSPSTLYAFLTVVRQASENFRMEQSSRRILELLRGFRDEWQKYVDQFGKLGEALEKARKEYDALTTTRTRKLDKTLAEVDRLKVGEDAKGGAVEGAA